MPLYTYECEKCGTTFDCVKTVEKRKSADCDCGGRGKKILSSNAKPVVYEYYSENLNAMVTGPKQRKKLAESMGLLER